MAREILFVQPLLEVPRQLAVDGLQTILEAYRSQRLQIVLRSALRQRHTLTLNSLWFSGYNNPRASSSFWTDANILDIYNTSGALSSVLTAGGSLGLGTTSPGTILSLGDTGANTINLSTTATSTFGSGVNIRSGCFSMSGTCIQSATFGYLFLNNATSTKLTFTGGLLSLASTTIGDGTQTGGLTVSGGRQPLEICMYPAV